MSQPKAIVLKAAGINCDQESKSACEKVGFRADVIHVNRLVENKKLVHDYQFLIVPGGFSFGDDQGRGRSWPTNCSRSLSPSSASSSRPAS